MKSALKESINSFGNIEEFKKVVKRRYFEVELQLSDSYFGFHKLEIQNNFKETIEEWFEAYALKEEK